MDAGACPGVPTACALQFALAVNSVGLTQRLNHRARLLAAKRRNAVAGGPSGENGSLHGRHPSITHFHRWRPLLTRARSPSVRRPFCQAGRIRQDQSWIRLRVPTRVWGGHSDWVSPFLCTHGRTRWLWFFLPLVAGTFGGCVSVPCSRSRSLFLAPCSCCSWRCTLPGQRHKPLLAAPSPSSPARNRRRTPSIERCVPGWR